jgi:putative inorganic carbon (HCO3(-)) transporter
MLAAAAGGGGFGLLAGINPLVALATALALAYAGLTIANVRLGLCLFTIIAFIDLFPVPLGSAASLTKLAGVVLALAWLASRVLGRSAGGLLDEQPWLALLIVGFLAWATLTSVWAPSSAAAFGAVARYALNGLFFVIVVGAVRTRRDVTWVVSAFLVGAAFSAAYGIAVPSASTTGEADVQRVTGTIGDPNEFAAVLVAALPLGVALAAAREWSRSVRALGIVTAGLSVAGVLLSLSRGGFISLLVVLVAGAVLAGRWRSKALLVAPLVILAGVGYLLANPAALQRVSESNGGTGRTDLWQVGWRMVRDQPVLGVGAGNFTDASIHYLLQPGRLARSDLIANTPKVAHNTYLTIFAELGLVGASMFLALTGVAIASGIRAARVFARQRDGPMEMLTRGWLTAMAGLLTADAFLSAEFSKQLWLLLALGPAFLAVACLSLGEATPRPDTRRD